MKYYFVSYVTRFMLSSQNIFNRTYIKVEGCEFVVTKIEDEIRTKNLLDQRHNLRILSKEEVSEAEYLANIQN